METKLDIKTTEQLQREIKIPDEFDDFFLISLFAKLHIIESYAHSPDKQWISKESLMKLIKESCIKVTDEDGFAKGSYFDETELLKELEK